MSTYTPDRWVVIEFSTPHTTHKKVLASWYGGYTSGDSWKLSSAIENQKEYETSFVFNNASGSTYQCYKNEYGMSMYTASIYASFVSDVEKHNAKPENKDNQYTIEVVAEYEPDRKN